LQQQDLDGFSFFRTHSSVARKVNSLKAGLLRLYKRRTLTSIHALEHTSQCAFFAEARTESSVLICDCPVVLWRGGETVSLSVSQEVGAWAII
jgi:hypothetical protein